jgi:cytochrome P450
MLDSTILTGLGSRWPLIAASAALLFSAWLVRVLASSSVVAKIPAVGQGSLAARQKQFNSGKAWDLYMEGYRKLKAGAGVFRIATTAPAETIVVSSKYLNELRKLPDDVISFTDAVAETMQSQYTKLDVDVPGIPHTVRASLTPALVRLNTTISKEVFESMELELPQGSDWTEVNIFSKLLRIVAMVSGRIFVGPELCRDERYLDAAINYTVDLITAVQLVSLIPQWRRPISAPAHPSVQKVHQRVAAAMELLEPVVAARQEAAQRGDEKPDDMLQWIIDGQLAEGRTDSEALAKSQLGISFAAIHTTTLTVTNALYTLAAMPELSPMLREDVQQALDAAGGEFTNLSMQNMKKLDSFLKEVMRFYPLSPSSFQRKVNKTFQLSDGQVIPAGVFLEVPSGGIHFDEELFPNADKFEPLRFYDMRQSKTKEQSHTKAAEVVANSQFVSVGQSSLSFGYGRHACPGRFFAVNEIKMIMACILLRYEISNPPGVTERHKNQLIGAQIVPDATKSIMVRKI